MQDMDNDLPERPSRSERKREMLALQKIGEVLVDLPEPQLAKIPLEPNLLEAIKIARSLKSREGKRRQLQYIGRLMRHTEIQPIEDALNKIQNKDQQSRAQFHQMERWRDKLIIGGDKVLDEFLQQYPKADSQLMRQLMRRAQQDKVTSKNSGAERELFRYLRELLSV